MEAKIYNFNLWIGETHHLELKKVFEEILIKSNFTILNFIEHFFEPHGYTALWLLAESHLAIHTFPEENKTYVELSSCEKKRYDDFIILFESKYH